MRGNEPVLFALYQDTISDSPSDLAVHNLSEMNSHLRSILAQWFSVGLLDLHKVTWETPCDIMEKVTTPPPPPPRHPFKGDPQYLKLLPLPPSPSPSPIHQISQYEAVHPFRHWRDLKHRVGPNRRCFAFSHRAFPRDPIVVLHAALTREAAYSIQVRSGLIPMGTPVSGKPSTQSVLVALYVRMPRYLSTVCV